MLNKAFTLLTGVFRAELRVIAVFIHCAFRTATLNIFVQTFVLNASVCSALIAIVASRIGITASRHRLVRTFRVLTRRLQTRVVYLAVLCTHAAALDGIVAAGSTTFIGTGGCLTGILQGTLLVRGALRFHSNIFTGPAG